MTTEQEYLKTFFARKTSNNRQFGDITRYKPTKRNPARARVGSFYSSETDRIRVTARTETEKKPTNKDYSHAQFLLAGPRAKLWKDPSSIRAAILTGGGVAPGLNRVIHSIVVRHYNIYELDEAQGGIIYGIHDGFAGLSVGSEKVQVEKLCPKVTEDWADRGGTMLGSVRGPKKRSRIAETWLAALREFEIDILYVIGGDGSLMAAHRLSEALARDRKEVVVAGIPKTMDNDILWTDQSFGYQSTIDEAAHIIRALGDDAFSTRRLCLVKLFGRKSGFVAAAASLASGCVDAVLVPEEFQNAKFNKQAFCEHLREVTDRRKKAGNEHAVVVVAEGVKPGRAGRNKDVLGWLKENVLERMTQNDLPKLERRTQNALPKEGVFVNEPRHLIRAIPPNPFDQIFCEQLASCAVDNALAGFTDFVVTRWMSSYVLVPLKHVADQTKTLDINGLFWKQVVNATGQPSFRC